MTNEKKRNFTGAGVLLAGCLLMIAGIVRQEPATVLMKAVAICMECIGIG